MNPIEAAVAPLKNDAIESARQRCQKMIDNTIGALQDNNWDAQIVAPYPNSRVDYGIKYHTKLNDYRWTRSITVPDEAKQLYYRRPNDPEYRQRNADMENAMIKQWEDFAAAEYEAFVAKLVGKIGEVVSATLEGNHVWGYSVLHVVKPDGTKEKWKTQMIYKVSKLGKPHNQWPSRKVK